MTALLAVGPELTPGWEAALRAADPELRLEIWPNARARAEEVEYLILGPAGAGLDVAGFPNLKAVLSIWAGVEKILANPTIPQATPIVRMVEPGLTQGMVEYALGHVMAWHVNRPLFARQQRERVWRRRMAPFAGERRVGIFGLGALGRAVADAFRGLGFQVCGWRRGAGAVPGVETYWGREGFHACLARSDAIAALLPDTEETRDIFNAAAFASAPEGAMFLNAGRGGCVVDDDLLAALASGRLSHAVLDVFRDEPLAADHPFWRAEGLLITPHSAAFTRPETGAPAVVDAIARIRRGAWDELPLVARERAY